MRFDVVTLFPEIFDSITKCGITARAMKRGLWSCHTWNPRAMTEDVHRTVGSMGTAPARSPPAPSAAVPAW